MFQILCKAKNIWSLKTKFENIILYRHSNKNIHHHTFPLFIQLLTSHITYYVILRNIVMNVFALNPVINYKIQVVYTIEFTTQVT